MKDELQDTIKVMQGDLVIGNHDAIILLGSKPQSSLRDVSKSISNMLLESSIELDVTISDVVYEIEKFYEVALHKSNSTTFRKNKTHKRLLKKYTDILSAIDNVSLYFKLQQVQLLKEIKILEALEATIEDNKKELEMCINKALKILEEPNKPTLEKSFGKLSIDADRDVENWYLRLEKRIQDLKISHTVYLQNQAQVKMLNKNNRILIDKLASAISNTIPIWQNQMALLLGVELLENRLNVQAKVLQITSSYFKKAVKTNKRIDSPEERKLNIEKMLSLNQNLQLALNEIDQVEKEDISIRNKLQNILSTER